MQNGAEQTMYDLVGEALKVAIEGLTEELDATSRPKKLVREQNSR